MKTRLLIAALIVCFESAYSQTNEPLQIKFYSATNYTNTIHLHSPGPTRWISGDIDAVYYKSKRVAVLITDQNDADYGKEIIIQNCPNVTVLAIGQSVSFSANKIGTIQGVDRAGDNVAGLVLELWDYVDLDAAARRFDIADAADNAL
jgi:hypothetical protein